MQKKKSFFNSCKDRVGMRRECSHPYTFTFYRRRLRVKPAMREKRKKITENNDGKAFDL